MNISFNPTGRFNGTSSNELIEACGLLPPWITDAIKQSEMSVWDYLSNAYGMGMFEIDKVVIKDRGIWTYPDDPDLHPLVKFEGKDKIVYVYRYGMVAIKEAGEEEFRCTRMD